MKITLSALLLIFTVGTNMAATLNVPGTFATIQAGLCRTSTKLELNS